MFTGIVSHIGKVNKISHPDDWELSVDVINDNNSDNDFNINSISIGASISCSGICLTLKQVLNKTLFFDVSEETREKTNFSTWKVGSLINLEKSLKVGDELGGHFVYGHVDTTAVIKIIEKINGSYKITFTINKDFFTVNIVPYTWTHTSFKNYNIGTVVNIEIDILARYLESLNSN